MQRTLSACWARRSSPSEPTSAHGQPGEAGALGGGLDRLVDAADVVGALGQRRLGLREQRAPGCRPAGRPPPRPRPRAGRSPSPTCRGAPASPRPRPGRAGPSSTRTGRALELPVDHPAPERLAPSRRPAPAGRRPTARPPPRAPRPPGPRPSRAPAAPRPRSGRAAGGRRSPLSSPWIMISPPTIAGRASPRTWSRPGGASCPGPGSRCRRPARSSGRARGWWPSAAPCRRPSCPRR